jgi:hypothetical protein
MKKLSKSMTIAVALIAVLSVSLVYAVVFYTLSVPNQMRLKVAYGLELRTPIGVPIISYDWGEFDDGQKKYMVQEGAYLKLKNTGNSVVNVVWSAIVPSEWTLVVRETGTPWNSGSIRQIPIGGELSLIIELTEVSAAAGVSYNFDLKFDITD